MPIYEFECNDCKCVFERMCKMDESLKSIKCQHCGGSNIKRLISTFAAHVKEDGGRSKEPPPKPECMGCNNKDCPHAREHSE